MKFFCLQTVEMAKKRSFLHKNSAFYTFLLSNHCTLSLSNLDCMQ